MSSPDSGEPNPEAEDSFRDPVPEDPFEVFRRLDPIIKEQYVEADEEKLDEIISTSLSGPNILRKFLNRFRHG